MVQVIKIFCILLMHIMQPALAAALEEVGFKVESKAGGSAWEDSDGARGWTVFASAAAVLAGLAF